MAYIQKLLACAEIETATKSDYAPFAHLHYRKGSLAAVDKVYALRLPTYGRVGIIVYSYPPPHLLARRLALGAILPQNPTRSQMMTFINANIRIISRVVVLPQFRGASLAKHLVAATTEKVDVPIIEAVAAMGQFNRFFTKAGLTQFIPPPNPKKQQLKQLLLAAGFTEDMMLSADLAAAHLKTLDEQTNREIDRQTNVLLGAYGRKRLIKDKKQKIKTILSKLNSQPTYFYKIKP